MALIVKTKSGCFWRSVQFGGVYISCPLDDTPCVFSHCRKLGTCPWKDVLSSMDDLSLRPPAGLEGFQYCMFRSRLKPPFASQ
jgi:hypothetical protein